MVAILSARDAGEAHGQFVGSVGAAGTTLLIGVSDRPRDILGTVASSTFI
jgi:hypothetical protein